MNKQTIVRASTYGIIAGTINTIVIDILALIMLAAKGGVSLSSFFALNSLQQFPVTSGFTAWTVPELLLESKGLIPALQQLLTGDKVSE
jgi:hypothetical protein